MTKKILRAILLASTLVLLASFLVSTLVLYSYFGKVQTGQLQDELALAAAGTEQYGLDYLHALGEESFRLTWIDQDGTVLFDSAADETTMENHLNREEIQQAFATGHGSSTRTSDTLTKKLLYEAQRLDDGTVLRISVSSASAAALALGLLQPVLFIFFAALVLSAVLATAMAKKITDPLNRLDLEHPLENNAYEELAPLLRRIHQQHQQISGQLGALRQKTDEFQQITDNLREGLVLLDGSRRILSINPAARILFGADTSCVGEDFLTIERRHDISAAIETALRDGHSELRTDRDGREYQLDISRIESGGKPLGAVLLSFDVTAQAGAERSRREFSANVSHELKTPLQSILGSAELIENGMVKPEDLPRFVGHIRSEAARLVALVEDIIRLSQLDEGEPMPAEPVSLYALSQDVQLALRDAAGAKDVTVTVRGDDGAFTGVRRLLYEIVYNLCDNAIRYNVDGGRVDITIADAPAQVTLTVADTGIGIPPEQQERVFERFYRVDKSHSRKSGGTGLGLSIVKHAVQLHHAKLTLESTPGQGTTITVVFPKQA